VAWSEDNTVITVTWVLMKQSLICNEY